MQTSQRKSNIELLRIICMIMILAIHVNYFSTGALTTLEAEAFPIQSILRSFAHAVCACAVNTFVMISGYFGIKFKTKSIGSLIFQCLFFCIGIYIVMISLDLVEVSRLNLASTLLLFKQADCYWFIWSYIILYILSPVLNSFSETCQRHEFKRTLILFFILQFIIDSTPSNNYFLLGYSPLSFIGLYLLIRYIKRFGIALTKIASLSIFIICVILNTGIEYSVKLFNVNSDIISSVSMGNTNPITIIQSFALLMYFTKLDITNRFINWLASSCLAVYLFHMHFCIVDYYRNFASDIYMRYNGFYYLAVISLMIFVFFILPIGIDKIRIICFNRLWRIIESNTK